MPERMNHPRPVAAEKLSLLSQLEAELEKLDTNQHDRAELVGGDEEMTIIDDLLEKLKDQVAGILQDRTGSLIVENIASRLSPGQLAVILGGCRGYVDSLASNKLSSHVLEILLRSASEAIEAELGATGESNGVANARERNGFVGQAATARSGDSKLTAEEWPPKLYVGAGFYVTAGQGRRCKDRSELSSATHSHTADTARQTTLQVLQDVILLLVSEVSSSLSKSPGKTWAKILSQNYTSSVVGLRLLGNLGGVHLSKRPLKARPIRAGHRALKGLAEGERNYEVDPETKVFVYPDAAAVQGEAVSVSKLSPLKGSEVAPNWYKPTLYRVPASFRAALEEVTGELAELPGSELQRLVCNRHAYRSLELLLEMHTTSNSAPVAGPAESPPLARLKQESPAMKLVAQALEWQDEVRERKSEDDDKERSSDDEDAGRSSEIVYAMAGDKWGSRFLLAVIRLTPQPFFLELYQRCFQDRPLQSSKIGVSKDFKLRFLQELFRRVQDSNLATNIVMAVIDHASVLLAYGHVDMLSRAAQLCVRQGLGADTQANLLEAIAQAVQQGLDRESVTLAVDSGKVTEQGAHALEGLSDQVGCDRGAENDKDNSGKTRERRLCREVVLSLLGQGSSTSNIDGMYVVHWLLQFEKPVVESVLTAVAELPHDVLAAVVRDEVGCQCVLESVLDAARWGPNGGMRLAAARQARSRIVQAFIGHLVDLACDRVAWTFVVQCFHDTALVQQTWMVNELATRGHEAMSRMEGCPSGRRVLAECMVNMFIQSRDVWNAKMIARHKMQIKINKERKSEMGAKVEQSKKKKRQKACADLPAAEAEPVPSPALAGTSATNSKACFPPVENEAAGPERRVSKKARRREKKARKAEKKARKAANRAKRAEQQKCLSGKRKRSGKGKAPTPPSTSKKSRKRKHPLDHTAPATNAAAAVSAPGESLDRGVVEADAALSTPRPKKSRERRKLKLQHDTKESEVPKADAALSTPEPETSREQRKLRRAKLRHDMKESEVPEVDAALSTPEPETSREQRKARRAKLRHDTKESEVPEADAALSTSEPEMSREQRKLRRAKLRHDTKESEVPEADAALSTPEPETSREQRKLRRAKLRHDTKESEVPEAGAALSTPEPETSREQRKAKRVKVQHALNESGGAQVVIVGNKGSLTTTVAAGNGQHLEGTSIMLSEGMSGSGAGGACLRELDHGHLSHFPEKAGRREGSPSLTESAAAATLTVAKQDTVTVALTMATKEAVAVAPTAATRKIIAIAPTVATKETVPIAPTVATKETAPVAPTVATKETISVAPTVATKETVPIAPTVATKETVPVAPTVATKETVPIAPTVATKETVPVAPTVATKETVPIAPTVATKETVPIAPTVATKETVPVAPTVATKETVPIAPTVATKETVPVAPTVATKETVPIAPTVATKETVPVAPTVATKETVPIAPTVATKETVPIAPTVATKETVPVAPTVATKETVPIAPTVATKETVPVAPTVATKETVPIAPTVATKETVPVAPTIATKKIVAVASTAVASIEGTETGKYGQTSGVKRSLRGGGRAGGKEVPRPKLAPVASVYTYDQGERPRIYISPGVWAE